MKKIKFVSSILAMVILFSCIGMLNVNKVYAADSQYVTVTTSGTYNYSMAQQVLTLVNQERKAEGLSSLELDEDLLDVAMFRAAETSIYWSHTRPNGTSCFTASSKMSAENIAALSTTAAEVMNSWMNSEGHKANILSSTYKSIGIGCYYSNGKYYWVQVFSNSSASKTSTKTGTKDVTNEIEVLGTSDYLKVLINGLASTKTLSVGNTYAATSVFSINQGWGSMTTYISLSDLTWESSDTSVCTVNENGKITAVGAGKAEITATIGESVTTYTITVISSVDTNNKTENLGTATTSNGNTNTSESSNNSSSDNTTGNSANNTNVNSSTDNTNSTNANSDSSESIGSNSSTNTTSNSNESTNSSGSNNTTSNSSKNASSNSSSTENTSSSPHTGDIAVEALIALMIISAIAVVGIIIKIKKNEEKI